MVELIVTLALAVVLIAAVAPLFMLMTRINNMGSNMAESQNAAQIRMELIDSKLRYSALLSIKENIPANFDSNTSYIYVESGNIKIKEPGKSARDLLNDEGSGFTYALKFTKTDKKVLTLEMIVYSKDAEIHKLQSKIFMVNIRDEIAGIPLGNCIEFQSVGDQVSSITVQAEGTPHISEKGKPLQTSAVIFPPTAENKSIQWSVDKSEIAEVNSEGRITPKKNGTVIVKAAAKDGSGAFGTIIVTIDNQ